MKFIIQAPVLKLMLSGPSRFSRRYKNQTVRANSQHYQWPKQSQISRLLLLLHRRMWTDIDCQHVQGFSVS